MRPRLRVAWVADTCEVLFYFIKGGFLLTLKYLILTFFFIGLFFVCFWVDSLWT